MNCIICNSSNTYIYTKSPCKRLKKSTSDGIFEYFICKECGFIFLSNNKILDNNLYDKNYYTNNKIILERFLSFLKFIFFPFFLRNGNGKKILDIGCGSGSFLINCKRYNWDVYGIDKSSSACEISRLKLPKDRILNLSLEKCNFEKDTFDIISVNHVLEHLDNLSEFLFDVKNILKPNGILFIEIPNIGSLEFKIFKDNWFAFDSPYHKNHFKLKNLKILLDANGLEIQKYSNFTFSFALSFFRSFENYLYYNKNIKSNVSIKIINILLLPFILILIVFIRSASVFNIGGEILKCYVKKK